jgi:hypothetical protein
LLLAAIACEGDDDFTTDAATDGGTHVDAGWPDRCELAADPGPCDALFHRYYFDPQDERCEHFVFGGCQGNENNFASLDECRSTCHEAPVQAAACEVEGVVYPSGSEDVGDPTSCNTCACEDGELTACTDVACPEPCQAGTTFGVSCAQCGPTDACEVVRIGCLPSCKGEADCSTGACVAGVCRTLCG